MYWPTGEAVFLILDLVTMFFCRSNDRRSAARPLRALRFLSARLGARRLQRPVRQHFFDGLCGLLVVLDPLSLAIANDVSLDIESAQHRQPGAFFLRAAATHI